MICRNTANYLFRHEKGKKVGGTVINHNHNQGEIQMKHLKVVGRILAVLLICAACYSAFVPPANAEKPPYNLCILAICIDGGPAYYGCSRAAAICQGLPDCGC
jgi:hypothetical protein